LVECVGWLDELIASVALIAFVAFRNGPLITRRCAPSMLGSRSPLAFALSFELSASSFFVPATRNSQPATRILNTKHQTLTDP
jgi:hypothetical protein